MENTIGTGAAVEFHTVFAAVGIGQISVSGIIEEGHGNAALPRVEIDVLNLAASIAVGLAGSLAVGKQDGVYVFVCTHILFALIGGKGTKIF